MNENTGGERRPGGPRRPGWCAATLVSAALAGSMLLSACSGGSPSAAPSASRGQLTAQTLDAFAQCMRSHGVPDFYFSRDSASAANTSNDMLKLGPWVAPAEPNSPHFQAAQQACRHLLPIPQLSAAQQQSIQRRLLKQAACMRAHGYPGYPDPSVRAGGIIQPSLPSNIDTSSPQFQAAVQACNGG